MGKVKDNELQRHTLTEREFNLAKLMNTCLMYNVGRDQILSGFLSYIAHTRLGLDNKQNLQFEIDFDSDTREIQVKTIAPTAQ